MWLMMAFYYYWSFSILDSHRLDDSYELKIKLSIEQKVAAATKSLKNNKLKLSIDYTFSSHYIMKLISFFKWINLFDQLTRCAL